MLWAAEVRRALRRDDWTRMLDETLRKRGVSRHAARVVAGSSLCVVLASRVNFSDNSRIKGDRLIEKNICIHIYIYIYVYVYIYIYLEYKLQYILFEKRSLLIYIYIYA